MSHLSIHKTSLSDLDEVVLMETVKENYKFIFPNTKNEHIDLLNNEDVEHLLLKSESEEVIGFIILAGLKNKNRSIEFRRIVIKEKGKGFGRKAVQMIKKYCFEELNSHRLWLDVLENNERARHLYISEGFIEEGKLRSCILIEGYYHNLIIMSLLEDEYEKV